MFPSQTVLVLSASRTLAQVSSFSYLIIFIIHFLFIDNVFGVVLVSNSTKSHDQHPRTSGMSCL